MFQFPRCPSRIAGYVRMTARGFPHSEISGSPAVGASPEPIVAYTVLRRHSAPRHPPPALKWHYAAVIANRWCQTPVGCPSIIGSTRPARLSCGVAGFPNKDRRALTQSLAGGRAVLWQSLLSSHVIFGWECATPEQQVLRGLFAGGAPVGAPSPLKRDRKRNWTSGPKRAAPHGQARRCRSTWKWSTISVS